MLGTDATSPSEKLTAGPCNQFRAPYLRSRNVASHIKINMQPRLARNQSSSPPSRCISTTGIHIMDPLMAMKPKATIGFLLHLQESRESWYLCSFHTAVPTDLSFILGSSWELREARSHSQRLLSSRAILLMAADFSVLILTRCQLVLSYTLCVSVPGPSHNVQSSHGG